MWKICDVNGYRQMDAVRDAKCEFAMTAGRVEIGPIRGVKWGCETLGSCRGRGQHQPRLLMWRRGSCAGRVREALGVYF